jgi:hypothetical protein
MQAGKPTEYYYVRALSKNGKIYGDVVLATTTNMLIFVDTPSASYDVTVSAISGNSEGAASVPVTSVTLGSKTGITIEKCSARTLETGAVASGGYTLKGALTIFLMIFGLGIVLSRS